MIKSLNFHEVDGTDQTQDFLQFHGVDRTRSSNKRECGELLCDKTPETDGKRKAPARLRDYTLCRYFLSLASIGFLVHLKIPTDGALSTKCLRSPRQ